jgi:hypothetical protein
MRAAFRPVHALPAHPEPAGQPFGKQAAFHEDTAISHIYYATSVVLSPILLVFYEPGEVRTFLKTRTILDIHIVDTKHRSKESA